jgi:hypothetical protein
MILRTRDILHDYSLIGQCYNPLYYSDKLKLLFNGWTLPKQSSYTKIGLGMESPYPHMDISPQFGLESYDKENESMVVSSDGLCKIGLFFHDTVYYNEDEKKIPYKHKNFQIELFTDKIIFTNYDGTSVILTSAIPIISHLRTGMSMSIMTLEEKVQKLNIAKAFYNNY